MYVKYLSQNQNNFKHEAVLLATLLMTYTEGFNREVGSMVFYSVFMGKGLRVSNM